MIKIKSNAPEVILKLLTKVKQLQDINGMLHDKLVRSVTSTAAGMIRQRVHVEGINSSGSDIGSYSSAYLKYRQKKWNRDGSSRVILSASRQMENDLALTIADPIKTTRGYAVGFKNRFNADKAQWLQEGRPAHNVSPSTRIVNGKPVKVKGYSVKAWKGFGAVYALTQSEKKLLLSAAQEYINSL